MWVALSGSCRAHSVSLCSLIILLCANLVQTSHSISLCSLIVLLCVKSLSFKCCFASHEHFPVPNCEFFLYQKAFVSLCECALFLLGKGLWLFGGCFVLFCCSWLVLSRRVLFFFNICFIIFVVLYIFEFVLSRWGLCQK